MNNRYSFRGCAVDALVVVLCACSLTESAPDIPSFVFTKHFDMGGSHYAYTEGVSGDWAESHFHGGSALCRWRPGGVETLLESRDGVIRDPDVSYDAKSVLFAWKKSGLNDDYHLYEMDLESGDIRQLTFGKGFADYEAAYLPNGNIVFNSTRCVQRVDCHTTVVSNLFLCDGDGKYMRRISYDQVHTNYPAVLPDGRVVYTRWDYNDRGQLYPQPLFVMNPDGTAQTELYGNNSWYPTSLLHARGIPGTQKIVAILSGHHCRQTGKPAVINPQVARNCALGQPVDECGIEFLIDVSGTQYERAFKKDNWGQEGDQYQYPYALNENEFLIGAKLSGDSRYNIYYMKKGEVPILLASDPSVSCNQPVPIRSRRHPPEIASRVDYSKSTGTFSMQNVYYGPGLEGVSPGSIKKLRVVALEFRAETIHDEHRNEGEAGHAMVHLPVALEDGSWDIKRVLGDATVYEDGSAYFEVPARTPLYFQALNEKGHVVQTMRSWATLQPNEHFSCYGCHENKLESPPPISGSIAMSRGVEKLNEFYGPPRGFSFLKEIQPILNRHCTSCHNDSHKKLDLTDELFEQYSRNWTVSYRNLFPYISIIGAQSVPTMLPPYYAGAHQSMLVKHLETRHTQIPNSKGEVVLSAEEMDKIACWIDLLAPFAGDYTENLDREATEHYNKGLEKKAQWEKEEAENITAHIASRESSARVGRRPITTPGTTPSADIWFGTDGTIAIRFVEHVGDGPVVVSLFDMSGRRVGKSSYMMESGRIRLSPSRSSRQSSGIFLLRVQGNDYTSNRIINTGVVSRKHRPAVETGRKK